MFAALGESVVWRNPYLVYIYVFQPLPFCTTSGTAVPNAANGLIVGNLPFDVSEQDLRVVFLRYGPIHSIHLPMDKSGAGEGGGEASEGSKSL